MLTCLLLEPEKGRDTRMIQRGKRARFPLETPETLGIGRVGLENDLDRDLAAVSRAW
jgi:hypothetical protein